MDYTLVYNFWFNELTPKQWFEKSNTLDQDIKNRFLKLHEISVQKGLEEWQKTPKGALSEVILLDQFSRNIFRETKESFEYDDLALKLARESISKKQDLELTKVERSFLYMPFMHSESLSVHEEAVILFDLPGLEDNLKFELMHKKIIEKFGRYPHRNKILGRESTPEEIEFLNTKGSSF